MFAPHVKFAEYPKDQLQVLHALSHVALDAAGKIVALNMAAIQAVLTETAETTTTLLGAENVWELMDKVGTPVQPVFDKFLGYRRHVYVIFGAAGEMAWTILQARMAIDKEAFTEVVETVGRNAPTGSEPIASLVQNAFDAYGRAYDTMAKAARQTVESAQSNFASASEAAAEAVSAANDASKVKPKKAA
jgi:phasin family protein